jgi:hypothetical protein
MPPVPERAHSAAFVGRTHPEERSVNRVRAVDQSRAGHARFLEPAVLAVPD